MISEVYINMKEKKYSKQKIHNIKGEQIIILIILNN